MFKCGKCGRITEPREPRAMEVVEKREKFYEVPGGEAKGWEIVREIAVCKNCKPD